MSKKILNINTSATQTVNDINSNFDELYQNAGSGGSVDGLPTKRVKVYDVMTRGGGGTYPPVFVPCNIKAGTKYIIEKAETGTNWDFQIVSTYLNGAVVQELLKTQSGITSKGDYNIEIEATGDADSFGITGYPSAEINIYHYEDVPILGNRWLGKRWLLLGDSISTEHGSYAQVGYGESVAYALGMYRTNRARSGETSMQQCIRVSGYRNDYDLITAMVGTNDQGYGGVLVGSLTDAPSQDGSFYARMKFFYETLRTKYPKSVIAFITPIRRYNVAAGTYYALEPFVQAVRDVCEYYATPCIDVYNAIDPSTQAARDNFFCSQEGVDDGGCHPNDVGHALFIAPIVEARLRDIAPFYFNDWEALAAEQETGE